MEHIYGESPITGPGRKTKLSGLEAVVVIALLLLSAGVFCFALFMAANNRVTEIRLDPYATLTIEGAEGYGHARAQFDSERFAGALKEQMMSTRTTLTEDEISELADTAANSAVFDYSVEKINGGSSEGAGSGRHEPSSRAEGISNGDTVTLLVMISDEAQNLLKEKEFSFEFDCKPLVKTVSGLPEAEPYDPFADLEVGFSGFEGTGMVSVEYKGQYPIAFTCAPEHALHNGDSVQVEVGFLPEYDIDSFMDEYHVVPSAYERDYVVSGLLINPMSIDDFTVKNLREISDRARTAALILIQDEYKDDEEIVRLENAGMYYAVLREDSADDNAQAEAGGSGEEAVSSEGSGDRDEDTESEENSGSQDGDTESEENSGSQDGDTESEENSGSQDGDTEFEENSGNLDEEIGSGEATDDQNEDGAAQEGNDAAGGGYPAGARENFLICAFKVNYADEAGQEMKYYYYIRYDNLVLDEEGKLIADFTKIQHPAKSTTPIELVFGEGNDVSPPGLFNFRLLSGFETLDDLYSDVLAPRENDFDISSLVQP